jgi:hypothetical protein
MTPTRELALQITKECKKFSKTLGLRVVCVYGGTGISEQVVRIKHSSVCLSVCRVNEPVTYAILLFSVWCKWLPLKIFKVFGGEIIVEYSTCLCACVCLCNPVLVLRREAQQLETLKLHRVPNRLCVCMYVRTYDISIIPELRKAKAGASLQVWKELHI